MGNFSRDTFDANNRYVSVRLQQGVPLIDADWNEKEDIRRFELQALLKWFIGDGVPASNNGYRIQASSSRNNRNNFLIVAGGSSNGLEAGRYLVNGLEVFITENTSFTSQPLHVSQGGSAQALALRLGVPVVDMPASNSSTILAYLDVWEREVTSKDNVQLMNPLIGVESCVRIKREWVVRVRPGVSIPEPGSRDYIESHSYAPLATITRRADDPTIRPEDITDLRQTGITLTALLQRIQFLEQQLLAPKLVAPPNEFWPPLAQPGVSVRIFGNNFTFGTPTVQFGSTPAEITSVTATEIVATVPNPPGPRDVRISVRNDFEAVSSSSTFRIPATGPLPPLNQANPFSPPQARPGDKIRLVFDGSSLNTSNLVIWFGRANAPILSTNVRGEGGGGIGIVTFTDVTIQVPPSAPPGKVQIAAQNNNGIVFGSSTFTVQPSVYGTVNAIGGSLL